MRMLIIAILLVCACKQEVNSIPEKSNYKPRINKIYSEHVGLSPVKILCIEGYKYITYRETIIQAWEKEGVKDVRPQKCK